MWPSWQRICDKHAVLPDQELHVLGMHTSPHVWDRPDDFLPVTG